MTQIAISSWTVHGLLGETWYELDDQGEMVNRNVKSMAPQLDLLDLPGYIARDGIYVLELCNFHLPRIDDDYLATLRQAIEDADVTLANLLIDTTNISSLDDEANDVDMTKLWQDVAAKLGAKGTRIDCGTDEPTPATIKQSATALRDLYDHGQSIGIETTVENWRQMSIETDNLFEIMKQADRPLKLCADFGNAEKTPDKYATLEAVLEHADSIHCKGHFDGIELNVEEFKRSLDLIPDTFNGHISLITDGTDNEWDKVLILKEHIEQHLS